MPYQITVDLSNIAIVIVGLWISNKIRLKAPTIGLLVKIFFIVLAVLLSLSILLRAITFQIEPNIDSPVYQSMPSEMEITV